jgi:hypothetical protein
MRRTAVLLALASTLALACKGKDNTKIVVAVWSDLAVPAELDSIRIDVAGTGSRNFPLTAGSDPSAPLAQLELVPLGAKNETFTVTATGLYGPTDLVAQTARVSFVPGQSLLLKLFLAGACEKVLPCSAGFTCAAGSCNQPIAIPNLPPYTPSLPLSPPDAGALIDSASGGIIGTGGVGIGGSGGRSGGAGGTVASGGVVVTGGIVGTGGAGTGGGGGSSGGSGGTVASGGVMVTGGIIGTGGAGTGGSGGSSGGSGGTVASGGVVLTGGIVGTGGVGTGGGGGSSGGTGGTVASGGLVGSGGIVATGGAGTGGSGGSSGGSGGTVASGGVVVTGGIVGTGGIGTGGAVVAGDWAGWPMPNDQVDVTAGAPNLESYTDNGDSTVTDNITGLMWQQALSTTTYTWAQAVAYCPTLSLASHNDWRLPSRIELVSIVDFGVTSGATINATYFPSTPADWFWSSSPLAGSSSDAWFVSFVVGNGYALYSVVSGTDYVRCVR